MHLALCTAAAAVPAVNRTADEHRHAVEEGAIRTDLPKPQPADVVAMSLRAARETTSAVARPRRKRPCLPAVAGRYHTFTRRAP